MNIKISERQKETLQKKQLHNIQNDNVEYELLKTDRDTERQFSENRSV
jgi:hypothetical protein